MLKLILFEIQLPEFVRRSLADINEDKKLRFYLLFAVSTMRMKDLCLIFRGVSTSGINIIKVMMDFLFHLSESII